MDGRRHEPSGEADDGRGHEGLSGLCGVAKAKEECGEVGSRSQRSTGGIVDSGASCVPSQQGSAMRTRQPARHITATACCHTSVSGAHMLGHGGHRQGHCRASGDGTEPVPSLTAAGTEAHGGKMTGAARQGQHGE